VAFVFARGAGDIEAGLFAGAGKGDVAPFLEAGFPGAEHEGAFDGEPLGGVAGERVGVADVSVLEVAAVELDGRAAVGGNREGAPFGVDALDGAGGAVLDGELVGVAQADDAVAGGELALCDAQPVFAEAAVGVHQLAPIAVRVTEHRLHGVCCPECATSTRAVLPREVPRSAFGPRLQAALVTLAVRNRVSRRDTSELARELFGVELATGSVDTIIQRAREALAGPYRELEQRIKSAFVVNIDETGWKTAGGSRTLWGALTSGTALFRIAAGRHAFEARTLLGERFAGIVCSDRWRGYDYLDPSQRQLC
jgi:hypothetical protein